MKRLSRTELFQKRVNIITHDRFKVLDIVHNNKAPVRLLDRKVSRIFRVSTNNFMRGRRPKWIHHRMTKSRMISLTHKLGYQIQSRYLDSYRPIKLEHLKCHHQYWSTPRDFEAMDRCPFCYPKQAKILGYAHHAYHPCALGRKSHNHKYTYHYAKQAIDSVSDHQYVLIRYDGNQYLPSEIYCKKCHHKFISTVYNVVTNGYLCPYCRRHVTSYGELYIAKFLLEHNFKAVSSLKSVIKTNNSFEHSLQVTCMDYDHKVHHLSIDFVFNYHHRIYCLEFNGQQHYSISDFAGHIKLLERHKFPKSIINLDLRLYHEKLKRQQDHDRMKNQWCIRHLHRPIIYIENKSGIANRYLKPFAISHLKHIFENLDLEDEIFDLVNHDPLDKLKHCDINLFNRTENFTLDLRKKGI